MKVNVYTVKGVAKGDVFLPKEYSISSNDSLLAQAIRVYEDSSHFGLNKVKTRSEVNKTKKKLYKQKGTGGARHGAKSAHIFVGGGVAHGPTGVKRKLNLPTKMKKAALLLALTQTFKKGKAVLVENMGSIKKTKEANNLIESLRKVLNVKSQVSVVLAKDNIKSLKFFKNIKNINMFEFSSLNAFSILRSSALFIDSSCFNVEPKKKIVKKVAKS